MTSPDENQIRAALAERASRVDVGDIAVARDRVAVRVRQRQQRRHATMASLCVVLFAGTAVAAFPSGGRDGDVDSVASQPSPPDTVESASPQTGDGNSASMLGAVDDRAVPSSSSADPLRLLDAGPGYARYVVTASGEDVVFEVSADVPVWDTYVEVGDVYVAVEDPGHAELLDRYATMARLLDR